MIPIEIYELARALDDDPEGPCANALAEAWRIVKFLEKAGYAIQPIDNP